MPSKTGPITYVQHALPAGSNMPVTWYFQLKDSSGAHVGAEQTFSTPTPTVSVTAAAGTYTVTGGQRDTTGAEMGVPVTSAPFALLADIMVEFVGAITFP